MRTKNLLSAFFTVTIVIASTVLVMPIKAQILPTVVYVEPAMYDGTNVPVGTIFDVKVYIENAVDMVGWSLSVKVDPTILEVMGVYAPTSRFYIIDDYQECVLPLPPGIPLAFDPGDVDKAAGKITDVSHWIVGWPDLVTIGVGGFDGSIDPITGGKAKLCMIAFKTKSQTAYSPIDLFDVKIFDCSHAPDPWFYVPTVTDGSYNVAAKGAIDGYVTNAQTSAAIAGASVVANGYGATTDANGYYKISDIAAKVYAVTASATGFDSQTASVTVIVGVTTRQDFALELLPPPPVHDLAVTSVVPSKLTVLIGESVDIAVTVENQGNQAETFTVNVLAGAITVSSKTGSLAGGATGTYTVTWITIALGSYAISARVPPVMGETDTADNSLADGTVVVVTVPFPIGWIDGTVTDSMGPIAGATVTANGYTATTDANGYYKMQVAAPITYTVTVSATGYSTSAPQTVTVAIEETKTVNFLLTKLPVYGATLAGRSAWPEHHHFVMSKDEDGIQTLFGKVKNTGTVATEVKVVFKIAMDTAVMETIESNVITLDPGMIGVVNASFTPVMTGKYSISSTAWYKDASGAWVEDPQKVKTFSFTVVP